MVDAHWRSVLDTHAWTASRDFPTDEGGADGISPTGRCHCSRPEERTVQ